MLLMFGKATVDTKGLPRVSVINSHGRGDGTVYIAVRLESGTRAAVEKWATRLGVEAAESAGYRADERAVRATAVSDGYELHVYTYVPAAPADSDPAEFPWRVYAQPEEGARWLVNAFATRERAERFVDRHPDQYGPLTIEPADPPADVHPELVDGIAPATETAPPPQQEMTHHAVMRHGIGGPECGTGRVWEPMTRAWKDVTCPDCLASLDVESGGAQ